MTEEPVVSIPESDLGQLLAVATLYVESFRENELMTLPEKFGLQLIEEILDKYGRRY